jgi:hypothetical protein
MDQAKRYLKDNGLRWVNFVNVKEMEQIEKRILNAEFRVENRDGIDWVEGDAAIANSWSEDLGGFREMIMPHAFDEADVSDVRVLKNHNPDFILGRTTAKTAEVIPLPSALHYRYVDGGTSYGKDLLISIKRGDVNQSSFAFTVAKDGAEIKKASDGMYERRIYRLEKIYDVSPVTFPAYPDTTVAKRSIENIQVDELSQIKAEQEKEQAQKDLEEMNERIAQFEINEANGLIGHKN